MKPMDVPPSERIVDTIAAQVEAIDAVLALASRTVRVFDVDLAHTGWNAASRAATLAAFLRRDPQARLRIVLHETQYLEQSCARLVNLLQRHPEAIEIRRSGPTARGAMDPLVIVDERHHVDHPRAAVALEQPGSARPLLERFEEIWASGEPGVTATVLGL
jgi:hypothetical protein